MQNRFLWDPPQSCKETLRILVFAWIVFLGLHLVGFRALGHTLFTFVKMASSNLRLGFIQ